MNEIEDVSFLPESQSNASSSTSKRSMYEPDALQKCRQIVCSPRKAAAIVACFVVIIFLIALIAALARPSSSGGTCSLTTPSPSASPSQGVTTPMSTDGEPFPWTNIRLPDSILPLSYDLFLHPNLTTFHYTGNVSIVFQVRKTTDFVVFHSKELKIDKKSLKLNRIDDSGVGKEQVSVSGILEYTGHEQIYLQLTTKLPASTKYRLTLNFAGILTDNLAGFYRSSYDTRAREKRWLATTHFEATDARAAFPCFDEPDLKANFSLSMVREEGYISLFNTEQVGTPARYGEYFVDRFATSVTMSTYLVAFVVCDFGAKSALTNGGVNVSVYAPKEMLDQTDFALTVAVRVLDFYEKYYGIKYPLKKSDHIAIPDFAAGAMENWGLITYLMRSLLYDASESSADDKQWVAVVVAHELAHQWFGNLVTMTWWNDLWLNEGFARFVENLGTNDVQPDWQMPDQFINDALSVALYSDGLVSSHPISVPVNDPAEIGEIFDAISYEKGASVIRMLQSVIGENTFVGGLHTYLNAHQFGNAETDDLWAAMTTELAKTDSKLDIKTVMDTWTLQMGYPVVIVSLRGSEVHAGQERFLYNPRGNLTEEFQSPFGYRWEIPLTYLTQTTKELQPVQWMNKGNVSFKLADSPRWIKMNVNMTGFYRVHYDPDNWKALIDQLSTDHTVFSPADRASLISDAFALARSGHLNITVALEMTRYLVRETDFVAWETALSSMNYIGDLLEGNPEYDYYKTYMRGLIEKICKDLGWSDTGSHITKLLRASILVESLKLSVEENVEQVKQIFSDWVLKNATISPNLRSLVYMGGVKFGGDMEWNTVWKRFQKEQIPSEKSKLLYALAATTDSIRLTRFLQFSLDEQKVRSAETPSVIQSIATNPAGRVQAWRFVRMNWEELHRRYHNMMMKMRRIILGSAGHFTTQFDYDEVRMFFLQNLHGENLRSVSQTLDKIQMNIDWLERNKVIVIDWLMNAVIPM